MEWYEAEVRALEQMRPARPAMENPAVFYGSSSIRLWQNLAADLHDARALNLGFGGSTLQACVHFFERLVLPEHPATLVVYAGDNDLGDGKSPDEVLGSFHALLEKVQNCLPGRPFSFISIKPSPARFGIIGQIRRANNLIENEITRHPEAQYIDVFGAMLNQKGEPRAELFEADGLHMAPAGYALWTHLLEPFRNKIFTGESARCNSAELLCEVSESGIPQMVQPSTSS